MIRIATLGSLDVTDGGRALTSLVSQPKRAALLVFLALARAGTFRRRDQALALLWPELDETHARGALNQALTFLRRELGNDIILTRGKDEIGLDATLISCDVRDFGDAMARGDLVAALALYRGEFLPAFHVSDAAGFAEWVAIERARLRAMAIEAAIGLARQRQRAGELGGAREAARAALRIDPLSEEAVQQLVTVETALGNRVGALQAYESFRSRIAAELDAEPSPATELLMRELSSLPVVEAVPLPSIEARPGAPPAGTSPAAGSPRHRGRPVWRHPIVQVGGGSLIVLIIAMAGWPGRSSSDAGAQDDRDIGPAARAEALDAFTAAVHHQRLNTATDRLLCLEYANRAIALDSSYADAHYVSAHCHASIAIVGGGRPGYHYPRARAAAERALAIDSAHARAYFVLGWVRAHFEWDWSGAADAYHQGMRLDPNDASGRYAYGSLLASLGRCEDAIAEKQRALRLEPAAGHWLTGMSAALIACRRYSDGFQYARRTVLVDSTYLPAYYRMAVSLGLMGRHDEALAAARQAMRLDSGAISQAVLSRTLARAGRGADARRLLGGLERLASRGDVPASEMATAYAALGEREKALAWLLRAVDERDPNLVHLKMWPEYDTLRETEGFRRVLARLRFPVQGGRR